MGLRGKTVLVTGASSGIGKAQAIFLAKEGANVAAVANNNKEGLNDTVDIIRKAGGEAEAFIADIASSSQIKELIKSVESKYGMVDILCNTAGVFDSYRTSLETTEKQWEDIFNINVKGLFLLTNEVLPHMLEKKKGNIINIASIAGITAGGGGTAYVASKHAVVGYTKQLCLEFAGKGIRVNAIAPGSVMTEMHMEQYRKDPEAMKRKIVNVPSKRLGVPEDVAKLTVFLARDDSDYINGSIISIDGGRFANGGFFISQL